LKQLLQAKLFEKINIKVIECRAILIAVGRKTEEQKGYTKV